MEAEGARLRVPEGWLDFSRDSVGILWLVRRDFQASLSLEELHGAGEAGGAAAAARLLLRLETAGSAVRLVAPPAGDPESGAGTVSYQLVRESGEQVRVTLAERGGKIFAVTAVQQAGATAPFAELVRIQRGLVSDLLR